MKAVSRLKNSNRGLDLLPVNFVHDDLPRACISPLVITEPGLEGYPGMSSGTGFFARLNDDVYFLTALHCLELNNPPISFLKTAKRLTLPFHFAGTTSLASDFVLFDKATRLAEDASTGDFLDVIALRVRPENVANHQHLLSRSARLPPTGLWLDRFVEGNMGADAMNSNEPITFIVIGYPNQGTSTGLRYADETGSMTEFEIQSAQFTGNLRRSTVDHCLLLEGTTWPGSHAGFSGAPVFVQWQSQDEKQSALAGMVICGGDDKLHFVQISTLVRAIDTEKDTSKSERI